MLHCSKRECVDQRIHLTLVIDELCVFHHIVEVTESPKKLIWIGSSNKDLRSFPDDVRDVFGYALYQAQLGQKHPDAKPLKGFGGAGVLEVVEDFDGDTYRAVYTVRFDGFVYSLHAFQKKSKSGRATPISDIELIKSRLKLAENDYANKIKGNINGKANNKGKR